MKIKALLVLLFICCAFGVFADGVDERVRNRLNSKNFQYEIDDENDFKIIVTLDNGRTQLLWINSNTQKFKNMEIREVWSIGYKGDLSYNIMKTMLRDSETLKIGAWGTNKDNDRAIFSAKIPANLDADNLIGIIFLVGESADELEKEFHGNDDL